MKIIEIYQQKFLGYRIVGYINNEYRTIYGNELLTPMIGKTYEFSGNGLYLGTSKKFTIDHYSELTDYDDVLLTYEYLLNDIIKGDPFSPVAGEITVRCAMLTGIEHISV